MNLLVNETAVDELEEGQIKDFIPQAPRNTLRTAKYQRDAELKQHHSGQIDTN